MNWVMEHMGDDDFSSPFSLPNAAGAPAEEPVDEEHLGMIVSMGFTLNQAKKALKVRGVNIPIIANTAKLVNTNRKQETKRYKN